MCYNDFDKKAFQYREIRATTHYNTILSQITSLINRHDFDHHANVHLSGHKFSFKNKLYLLDATTIYLCLSVFPWVKFRQRKGAIKLHMCIDADSDLPTFMDRNR